MLFTGNSNPALLFYRNLHYLFFVSSNWSHANNTPLYQVTSNDFQQPVNLFCNSLLSVRCTLLSTEDQHQWHQWQLSFDHFGNDKVSLLPHFHKTVSLRQQSSGRVVRRGGIGHWEVPLAKARPHCQCDTGLNWSQRPPTALSPSQSSSTAGLKSKHKYHRNHISVISNNMINQR